MKVKDKNSDEKVLSVVEALNELYILGPKSNQILTIKIKAFSKKVGVNFQELFSILGKLKSEKLVKKIQHNFNVEDFPNIYSDDLYITLSKDFAKLVVSYLNVEKEEHGPGIIYLERNTGNLWHGDKSKFCYPMDNSKKRVEILVFLIENKGFQETKDISLSLGKKTKNLMGEITKLRREIKKFLGIDDLIENVRGSGYRVNPKYRITISKY